MEQEVTTPQAQANGSAAVAEEEAPQPVVETTPAEHSDGKKLLRYAAFCHVGPGAEQCEDGEDGSCGNPLHFHAYCRLPNQFQHTSIREKALAAKARRKRQLLDPATDAHVVLEGDLDMARNDRSGLIDELLSKDFWKETLEAIKDVAEREEFKTIAEDQQRLEHLDSIPEADRNADEHGELQRHIAAYNQAVQEAAEERRRPMREALEGKDDDGLVQLAREQRVENEASGEFNRVYSMWEMFVGTLRPAARPNERYWKDISELQSAEPEVVEALDVVFNDLESSANRGTSEGN